MRKTEISWWQLSMLLTTIPISSLTTFSPTLASFDELSRDAWMSVIFATLLTAGGLWLIYVYARRFQGMNLYTAIVATFGRYLGAMINAAICLLFLFWTAISLKQFAYFFGGTIYTLTPANIFVILLGILAIFVASEGIELIGRLGEASGTLLILGLVFYMTMTIPLAEFQFIKPILENGWSPMLRHSYIAMAVVGQMLWIGTVAMPHVNRIDQSVKAIVLSTGINTVFFVASIVLLISLFDVELLSELTFPTLSATRLIAIGDIFERLEWIAIIMWLGAMGVKVSLLLHSATMIVSAYTSRMNQTTVALLFGIAAVGMSMFLFPTIFGVFGFLQSKTYVWLSLPLQFIGVVVLIVAMARGVSGSRTDQRGHRLH